ncbi:DUF4136 domain-containing protein [Pseudoxanthomonas daejeonensis]|uniref:DUF4136 domain-containing protein n=1 Tax=Pseudoxanthomonas daejeonensis TaxID=266062 RepID=A0ABQ6Z5X2_9GAMM|nr:DUF4136 domain-containing protein [Pseudoxanthomonas daejeonensis]KAF1693834.1 hypothetical protein CSC65_11170 [Pseudoxanthomonas daejeonensis]UNK56833.1 DUF4136 domain-containing protein [Pseudoxanthomonas daejeonensis]
MKGLLVIAAIILMLAGCASTPTVHTDADPTANFSGYRTYTWLNKPDQQGVPPLASQRIVEYVNAQLAAKGWKESPNGDVAVVAHVATQQQQSLDTMYSGPMYGGWGWGPGWYGGGMGMSSATTRVRTYTVGTLVVDLFDVKTKQAIWRGTASDTVPDDPAKGDKLLRAGIAEMFSAFPPGSVPAKK